MKIMKSKTPTIETVPIKDLVLYDKNPKHHPEGQITKLKASLKEFGFINPVLVDADNVVIAGHGRLKAATSLKLKNAPVIRVEHLTPEQVQAYRIADNRLAELADWDAQLLTIELDQLDKNEF